MSDLQCPARIILARHGDAAVPASHASSGAGIAGHGVADGHGSAGLPRVLTPAGQRQSIALAETLADRRVAALWASTMARAQQTAGIVGERLALPVTHDDRLRELMVDEAAPIGAVPPAEPGQDPGDVYAAWLEGDLDGAMFGETGHEVVGRLRSVVEDAADRFRGETVLLVSHGGIIELGLSRLCRNLSRGFIEAHTLDNGEAVELDVDSAGWLCTRWAGQAVARS
ncbi:MAG TPA: histidine phosphatase family protein [Pedococcus sp.]|nr:histidine phosphatase family protein [Pedococcus sp.]